MNALSVTPTFDSALTTSADWLLAGCAAWFLVLLAAAGVEVVTRGRLRATTWVGCPAPLRRALVAGLGAALAAAPGLASAQTASSTPTGNAGSSTTLPVPARPLGTLQLQPGRVVVHPGDTLWRLTERRLPASRSAAAIADAVDDVYARNRGVIGPDPDLIRPGQRLVLPRPHQPGHPDDEQERS